MTPKTVLTPFGDRPIDKVHAVPKGGRVIVVRDVIIVIDANGQVIRIDKNDGTKPRGYALKEAEQGTWDAYAYWWNITGNPISSFTANWPVPEAPPTYNSQTIFLFNSIEPQSQTSILQPVLQYGPSAAGGGEYWAVASWWVVGALAYYTAIVPVSTGGILDGSILLDGGTRSDDKSDTVFNYTCSFTNIPDTSLNVSSAEELMWATVTLETWNVTTPTDYPPGPIPFTPINLLTAAHAPALHWITVDNVAPTVAITVNVDGAINAEITITCFPQKSRDFEAHMKEKARFKKRMIGRGLE